MPIQTTINTLSGTSPFDVYICQFNLTGCFYIDTITSGDIPYTFIIPAPYDTAESYCVKIIDDLGCVISGCSVVNPTPTPTNTVTPTNTPTISLTPSITPTISVTPSVTPTLGTTQTPTPTQTPTTTLTRTPTNTPSSTLDPYPFILAGYCYDGRMLADSGSFSTNCTQVQSGLGSATRYRSNYPYSHLFDGSWSGVTMYIYDTVTSSLLGASNPLADGCQYWDINSSGIVVFGYPQVGFDCTTPGGCCPGVAPSPS